MAVGRWATLLITFIAIAQCFQQYNEMNLCFLCRFASTALPKTRAGPASRTACSCASTAPASTARWASTSASSGGPQTATAQQLQRVNADERLQSDTRFISPQIHRVRLQLELVPAQMHAGRRERQRGEIAALRSGDVWPPGAMVTLSTSSCRRPSSVSTAAPPTTPTPSTTAAPPRCIGRRSGSWLTRRCQSTALR